MTFQPHSALLSFDELVRVAHVARELGVTTLRLTGGEPLVRKNLPSLVERLSALGFNDLALTTNAMLLTPMVRSLKEAGLKRVNISCDSLRPERFSSIRRRGDLATVLGAMDAVEAAGLLPLEVNVVILRDRTTTRSWTLWRSRATPVGSSVSSSSCRSTPKERGTTRNSSRARDLQEQSFQPGGPWTRSSNITRPPRNASRSSMVAARSVSSSSVTQPFCGTCNRLRLTADGSIRNCLFSDDEYSLRDLMRGGADEKQAYWRQHFAGPCGRNTPVTPSTNPGS